MNRIDLPREGWILYDGGCGFCFRWVHFWKKVIERQGFALKDLQSASADGNLQSRKRICWTTYEF